MEPEDLSIIALHDRFEPPRWSPIALVRVARGCSGFVQRSHASLTRQCGETVRVASTPFLSPGGVSRWVGVVQDSPDTLAYPQLKSQLYLGLLN